MNRARRPRGSSGAEAADAADRVRPALLKVVQRHLAGDSAGACQVLADLRAEGERFAVEAFLWTLARLITDIEQGPVTPDPAIAYDVLACDCINIAVPVARGTTMPQLYAARFALQIRPLMASGDAAFAAFADRVLTHAAHWPDQLQDAVLGLFPTPAPRNRTSR